MDNQTPSPQPPKFLEKMINKMEEVLTQPVSQTKGETTNKPSPRQAHSAQHAVNEPSMSDEYKLPIGTTITLPNGQSYVTKTESKIQRIEEGGEQ